MASANNNNDNNVAAPLEEIDQLDQLFRDFMGLSILLPNERNDCVWVTIAKLLDMNVTDLYAQIGDPRPLFGNNVVSADRIQHVLNQLGRAFYYSFCIEQASFEDWGPLFAQELKTTKIAVCYTRPNGSGHCVVYQLVSSSKDRISAPKSWKLVDYQKDKGGVDVEADVRASKIIFCFAVAPSSGDTTVYVGRPKLAPTSRDRVAEFRAARREAAQAASKAARAAIIAERRGLLPSPKTGQESKQES